MTHLAIESGDFGRFAKAARAGADELDRSINEALRKAGEPLGREVAQAGAARMPRRGGLAARLRRVRVRVSTSGGTGIGVEIDLPAPLGSLDAGVLRHPVFARQGRTRVSVTQRVPAKSYTAAFNKAAPKARERVEEAAQGVLDEIARKV